MADIYISYTSTDSAWAKWLHAELSALGHTPHRHEGEIPAGGDIYAWMETHLDASDHVLCLVSDEYLRAPYSTKERHAAEWQAASKRPGFVLYVVVKPCRLPTLADHIRRCELFGVSEDEARQRFHDFMQLRDRSQAMSFPGQLFALSNIPIRVPEHFLGRDEALTAIDRGLARDQGRVVITALHGLSGVGKTTLAAAYAQLRRADYRATWWIRAQSPSSTRTDLVGLGVRLGWVTPDAQEEPALAQVLERLAYDGDGVLLIYDNAIDDTTLKPFLPTGGGVRVLVTTNFHAWRRLAEPVEIKRWPKEVGADYLIARTGREHERTAAEALSQALGGLPLAHEQAAAYCERLVVSFAEYLQRFEAEPAKLLDDARHAPNEYHGGLTVAKTFALAIARATRLHPAASALLSHAALLSPEPIPLFLLVEGREALDEPLRSQLADDDLAEALAALSAFALIDREQVADERDPAIRTDCFRLHPLVRQVAVDGADLLSMQVAWLRALAKLYLRKTHSDPNDWIRYRRLHAHSCHLLDERMSAPASETTIAYLLHEIAEYGVNALAAYGEARAQLERARAIRERVLGADHPQTLDTLDAFASVLMEQGEIAAAQPLCEQVLASRERVLGSEHPDTAKSLHHLANLLWKQDDFAAALPSFERALAIREKTLAPDHPDTVAGLNDFATMLQAEHKYARARILRERVLEIYRNMLGPNHPLTAVGFNNLGTLHHDMGDYAAALPQYQEALAIREKVLGSEHPATARTLDNLAHLRSSQGDLDAAKPLYERALAIREKVLGPEHPDTARSFANLADLLRAQGDLIAARRLHERVLAMRQRIFGLAHSKVADSHCGLATALRDQGDLTAARMHYEQALQIREQIFGPEHSRTAAYLHNLADLLFRQRDFDAAWVYEQRAVVILERTLGTTHARTNRGRHHLARLALVRGQLVEALAYAETALMHHQADLGPSEPWTLDSARVVAEVLAAQGRLEEAAALRLQYAVEE